MKKFLICLFVAVLVISSGFTIFFLVGNQEKISLSASVMYANKGDEFTLDIKYVNKKDGTKVNISTSDENVLVYDNGIFKAVGGGTAKINVKTSNSKYRNLYCDVLVGDGTESSPYYIENANQMMLIGLGEYTLDKCFKLVNDIDLSEVNSGYFKPLGELSGSFDGNGYTIKNLYIDKDAYVANNASLEEIGDSFENVGLFNTIAHTGKIYNLKIEKATIKGSYNKVGTICGENYGLIERIEVKDVLLDVNAGYIGGIAGSSTATGHLEIDEESNTEKIVDYVATIARSSVNVVAGFTHTESSLEERSMSGVFGGIVGLNQGGILVYTYSVGKVNVRGLDIYGGLIGSNSFTNSGVRVIRGGNIKDSYTAIEVINSNGISEYGALIGLNYDYKEVKEETSTVIETTYNRFIGCYYDKDKSSGLNAIGSNRVLLKNGTVKDVNIVEETGFVYGYNSSDLKIYGNLISSKGTETKYWDFENVWIVDSKVNEGYPIIDYSKIHIDREFDFDSKETKITIKIYFDYNGATNKNGVDSKDVTPNEQIGNLPVPTKDGFTFAGWYLESTFQTRVYSSTIVNFGTNTLFAKWIKNGETTDYVVITFEYNDANSGNTETSRKIVAGSQIGNLPVPSKSGYNFAGWFIDRDYTTRVYATTTFDKNATLYARWTVKQDIPEGEKCYITLKSNLPNNDYWIKNTFKNANYTFNFESKLTGNETAVIGRVSFYKGSTITKSFENKGDGVGVFTFELAKENVQTVLLPYTTLYNGASNYSFLLNGAEIGSGTITLNSDVELIAKYNYEGDGTIEYNGKGWVSKEGSSPVQIKSLADWNNLVVALSASEKVSSHKYYFAQMNDINVDSLVETNTLLQANKFNGIYDGSNKKIVFNVKGISPFVNVLNKIESINVVYNQGNRFLNIFGGVAQCLAGGSIENCTVSGLIDNGVMVGGIVGYVSTKSEIGGGYQGCINYANIIIKNSKAKSVGGIIGDARYVILNASNEGKIEVSSSEAVVCVGGLVGVANDAKLGTAINSGEIIASSTATNGNVYAGGLIGLSMETLTISNPVNTYGNTASISATASKGAYAGGLVGVSIGSAKVTISNSLNSGKILANQTKTEACNGFAIAGGIIAYSANSETVIDGVTTTKDSSVSANSKYNIAHAGNIMGYSNDSKRTTISNSVYNGKIYVNANSYGTSMYAGGVLGCYSGVGALVISTVSATQGEISIEIGKGNAENIRYVGGIVGAIRTTSTSEQSVIENCANSVVFQIREGGGKVSYIGGIVGNIIAESSKPLEIRGNIENRQTADILNQDSMVVFGGFIGYARNVILTSTNSLSGVANSVDKLNMSSSGAQSFIGGVIGVVEGTVTINNSAKTSSIMTSGDIRVTGGKMVMVAKIVGYVGTNSVLNLYANSNNSSNPFNGGNIYAHATNSKTCYVGELFNRHKTAVVNDNTGIKF